MTEYFKRENRPGYKQITEEMRKKALALRSDPEKICGALASTKEDGICRNWAGLKTDHPGEGRCWLHDKEATVVQADLVIAADEYVQDPDILELSGEINMIREYIRKITGMNLLSEESAVGVSDLISLTESLRKLVTTKHQIEVQRNFLIPVTVAVNLARRISDIVSKYLPLEQRMALQEEVRTALRVELATGKGQDSDPVKRIN